MNDLNVESFRAAANGVSGDECLAYDTTEHKVCGGKNDGRLGYMSIVTGESGGWEEGCSRKTLSAFRECLGEKYGVFGEHAFDLLLSRKLSDGIPLRARDVWNVLGTIEGKRAQAGTRQRMLEMRLNDEITRQLETHPKTIGLPPHVQSIVRTKVVCRLFNPGKPLEYRSPVEISAAVSKAIDGETAKLGIRAGKVAGKVAGKGSDGVCKAGDREIVGLRNVWSMRKDHFLTRKTLFQSKEASVEDRLKARTVASGLRVNSHGEKLVLEKLKTNGVEPGFIAHRDWSEEQTRELMTAGSRLDRAAGRFLGEFRAKDPKLTDAQLKQKYFGEIRDRLLAKYMNTAEANESSIAKLRGRYIVKLDYNEGDRSILGKYRRSARTRDRSWGIIMREKSAATAVETSCAAVKEALSNDLTRMMGVPAQELEIICGKHLNGKPKLMLKSKMAEDYKDFDGNYLKDGRVQIPDDENRAGPSRDLGKYKAPFLLLADRDAVGSHGQNKGLIKDSGFFAIDPGHSLEGDGKYLEVRDDFSFSDKKIDVIDSVFAHKRYSNFSVFDDSNRSEKLKGWLQIREQRGGRGKKRVDAYAKTFEAYEKTFALSHEDTDDEKELKKAILAKIAAMRREFEESYAKLDAVFKPQVDLYEAVRKTNGEADALAAIDVLENFERATSPVRKYSKKGEVALQHLEVVPKTRTKWTARYSDGFVIYSSAAPLPRDVAGRLKNNFLSQGPCSFNERGSKGRFEVMIPVGEIGRFHREVLSEERIERVNPAIDRKPLKN